MIGSEPSRNSSGILECPLPRQKQMGNPSNSFSGRHRASQKGWMAMLVLTKSDPRGQGVLTDFQIELGVTLPRACVADGVASVKWRESTVSIALSAPSS